MKRFVYSSYPLSEQNLLRLPNRQVFALAISFKDNRKREEDIYPYSLHKNTHTKQIYSKTEGTFRHEQYNTKL